MIPGKTLFLPYGASGGDHRQETTVKHTLKTVTKGYECSERNNVDPRCIQFCGQGNYTVGGGHHFRSVSF